MRPLKNLARLLCELWAFSRAHKIWWIVPVVLILLIVGAVALMRRA